MPKVSVIIPNYNHAPYLRERIDSVLNQTFQDIEVIIFDDCSKDNSQEIIEQYRSHPKVSQIILNEVNSGSTFKQWEKGIRMAEGEWIWLAESDDYADPLFLETLLGEAQKYPSCGLAYCQSWRVDELSEIKFSFKQFYTERWENNFFNNGIDELRDYYWGYGIVNASAALFKKEPALKVKPDYMTFRFAGDRHFWMELLLHTDIVFVARELNFFRGHSKNVSNNSVKAGLDIKEGLKSLALLKNDLYGHRMYQEQLNAFVKWWAESALRTKNILPLSYHKEIIGYVSQINNAKFILVPGFMLRFFLQKITKRFFKEKGHHQ